MRRLSLGLVFGCFFIHLVIAQVYYYPSNYVSSNRRSREPTESEPFPPPSIDGGLINYSEGNTFINAITGERSTIEHELRPRPPPMYPTTTPIPINRTDGTPSPSLTTSDASTTYSTNSPGTIVYDHNGNMIRYNNPSTSISSNNNGYTTINSGYSSNYASASSSPSSYYRTFSIDDEDQPTHESIAPFGLTNDDMEATRYMNTMAINVDDDIANEYSEHELDNEMPTRSLSTMNYYYAPSSPAYTANSNPYAAYSANNNMYYPSSNNAYNNYVTYPNNNAYYAAPAYNNMYGYNNPYVASATAASDTEPVETDEITSNSTASTNTTHTNTTHYNSTTNATANISAMEHANLTAHNATASASATNTTHTNSTAAPGSNHTGRFNATVSLIEEHHRHHHENSTTHNTTHRRNTSLEHSSLTAGESTANRNVVVNEANPSQPVSTSSSPSSTVAASALTCSSCSRYNAASNTNNNNNNNNNPNNNNNNNPNNNNNNNNANNNNNNNADNTNESNEARVTSAPATRASSLTSPLGAVSRVVNALYYYISGGSNTDYTTSYSSSDNSGGVSYVNNGNGWVRRGSTIRSRSGNDGYPTADSQPARTQPVTNIRWRSHPDEVAAEERAAREAEERAAREAREAEERAEREAREAEERANREAEERRAAYAAYAANAASSNTGSSSSSGNTIAYPAANNWGGGYYYY